MGKLIDMHGRPLKQATAPAKKRSYVAAMEFARYGDFTASTGSADYELHTTLQKLRNKARWLARNSSAMGRFINLMKTNIIGENGFQFQCRVKKLNGTLDKSLNDAVEIAWRRFMRRPTACRSMTGKDLQNLAVASWCQDGEFIWEIVRSPRYMDGMAINPIDPDLLDDTLNEKADNGNQIRMGVEVDDYGAPVAYWFLTSHPVDIKTEVNPKKRHRRVAASRVIHGYIRTRPGQTRGVPPAATVINPIKMLDGYREAETTGRRIAASAMGFFTQDMPQAAAIKELAEREDTDDDLFEMDLEPGRFKQLPPGIRFDKFDPGGAQTDYDKFEAQIKKDQAMGFNLSAFSHGMETSGVSYSTGRSVLVEDRDYYKAMQAFIVDHAMIPLFEEWTRLHSLQDNSAIAPSRGDAVRDGAKFRGRGWDWVDPSKDVNANSEALKTHQTSLTRVAAQRGVDIEELMDEIQYERELAKSRGLSLDYEDGMTVETGDDDDDDQS